MRRFQYTLLTTIVAFYANSLAAAELTVSAAMSLKPALGALAKGYEAATKDKVTLNFGASGALEQQIANGAPVDVFLSAAAKPMNDLETKGLVLAGTRRDLLKNSLVLVVPKESKMVASFDDLKKVTVKRIAIGEPKVVSAGQYAYEVLASLKLTEALGPKLIQANNVRQVLTYVETKAVDAGFVYATDAQDSDKIRVVVKASAEWHSPIV